MNKELNIIGGVIGGNKINHDFFGDDFNNAINLDYENYISEHIKFCDNEDCISEDHEIESENYISNNDTYLIGYKLDTDTKLYIPDDTKDYSGIYDSNTNVLQVTLSKCVKLSGPCSPCYPMQGDLESSGKDYCYSLPFDYYDDDNIGKMVMLLEDIPE